MIAIAIFLTYALQFYVPMNIIWNNISKHFSEKTKTLAEYTTRFSMIVSTYLLPHGNIDVLTTNKLQLNITKHEFLQTFTVALAVAIPTIGPFMSLIGAVCVSTLGFMFPAIIEMITYYDRPGFGFLKWILWKDLLLVLCGIAGFVIGTYVSILEIKDTLGEL